MIGEILETPEPKPPGSVFSSTVIIGMNAISAAMRHRRFNPAGVRDTDRVALLLQRVGDRQARSDDWADALAWRPCPRQHLAAAYVASSLSPIVGALLRAYRMAQAGCVSAQ